MLIITALIPQSRFLVLITSVLHQSSILVSNLFNESGFTSWKRSMVIALSAKNMLDFVDGSISQPSTEASEYSQWYRVNSMVTSWLLNSLHKNIADSVLFFQSASQIWKKPNQRYEQTNGAVIYQIHQKLYSILQSSDDFQTYYTKMTKIWDELRMVQEFPECSCGTAVKINKFLKDQRLIQLLMCLNDSYKITRGQILMMKPLPSLSIAYSIITQKEQQREINAPSVINHEAIAMHASYDQASHSKRPFCSNCKKPGHTKAQCYRIIGFLYDFKFTKNKKEENRSIVQNVALETSTFGNTMSNSTTPTSGNTFTNEQYQQILQMFNQH